MLTALLVAIVILLVIIALTVKGIFRRVWSIDVVLRADYFDRNKDRMTPEELERIRRPLKG
jgi:hypothetical protein